MKLRQSPANPSDLVLDQVSATSTTTALVLYLFKTSGYTPVAASYSRSRVVNA